MVYYAPMKHLYDSLRGCAKEEEVKAEFCKFFKMKIFALRGAFNHPPTATAFRKVRLVGTAFHRRPVGRGVPPSRQVGSRVLRDHVSRRQSAPCAQTIPANRIAARPITPYEAPSEGPPPTQTSHARRGCPFASSIVSMLLS